MVYQAEKLVKESGSADAAAQAKVNDRIAKVREKMSGEDADAIKAETKQLMDEMNVLAQAAQSAGAQAGAQQQPQQEENPDGETVEAEFHEEDN